MRARGSWRLVGCVLVRNENVHVEQAIRNVAGACERIHAVDHFSDDGTWEILRRLAREYDHLDVRRSPRASTSHDLLERYAGTRTWVLGVDGDELYDPDGLERLRDALAAGAHADVFRLKGHVLNCDALDAESGRAWGWMAPPSRPVTKLFNFAAVESWRGGSQRLHDGRPLFREGFRWESLRFLSESASWDDDPLRCLHACFLPRSHGEPPGIRPNLYESRRFDRSPMGRIKRAVRGAPRVDPGWKRDWYARGERVCVDARPFLRRDDVRLRARPEPLEAASGGCASSP